MGIHGDKIIFYKMVNKNSIFQILNNNNNSDSDIDISSYKIKAKDILYNTFFSVTNFGKYIYSYIGKIFYQIISHIVFIGLPFIITIGLQKMDDIQWDKILKVAKRQVEMDTMSQINSKRNIKK